MSASTTADAGLPVSRSSPRARKWLTGLAVGLGAALLFFVVLVGGIGASMGPATVGLVIAAGALVFCLHSLYRVVQALAVPETLVEVARDADAVALNRRELREERRRLLRAINELKFDFEMGKLSEADYREVRETYELRAVEVMRSLDEAGELHPELVDLLRGKGVAVPEAASVTSGAGATEALAQAIEVSTDEGVSSDGDTEGLISESSEPSDPAAGLEGPATSGHTCSACGARNDDDARFCKQCGAGLKA